MQQAVSDLSIRFGDAPILRFPEIPNFRISEPRPSLRIELGLRDLIVCLPLPGQMVPNTGRGPSARLNILEFLSREKKACTGRTSSGAFAISPIL